MKYEKKGHLVALCDANNFFVSCERVFNPSIRTKPVIVLSNNDGCVVARSNESKKLGIKMGEPYFKCKQIVKDNDVVVFSSNFNLYADMSARLMKLLSTFTNSIDVYSIDEAFLDLEFLSKKNSILIQKYCNYIVKTVYLQLGLPISIGIGNTKTLAKLGATISKRENSLSNIVNVNDYERHNFDCVLSEMKVGKVWGVGRRYAKDLERWGVMTVKDFISLDNSLVREKYNVILAGTHLELLGQVSEGLHKKTQFPKSVMVSRSFRKKTNKKEELKGALTGFARRAVHTLYDNNQCTSEITVFIVEGWISGKYKSLSITTKIPYTNSIDLIVALVSDKVDELYNHSKEYKKGGIILSKLKMSNYMPLPMLAEGDRTINNESKIVAIKKISDKFGKDKIIVANELFAKKILPKKMNVSKKCLTNINELHIIS